jgi:ribosomal silencing factor RsfS
MTDEAEDIIVQILSRHGRQHVRLEQMFHTMKRATEEIRQSQNKDAEKESDELGDAGLLP